MFTVKVIKSDIDPELGESLNRESGRIYSDCMVHHWRAYKQSGGTWLSSFGAINYSRWRDKQGKVSQLLHSHSVNAAQEAFYDACKTTRALRREGIDANFPWRRHYYRTTTWKNTGIRKKDDILLLSLARGNKPIEIKLPKELRNHPKEAFKVVELVYSIPHNSYKWHITIDDGIEEPKLIEDLSLRKVMAIDLGEVHPATLSDGNTGTVITCRELRSVCQKENKTKSFFQSNMTKLTKGSRKWKKFIKSKQKQAEKSKNQKQDLLHKISKTVIDVAEENNITEIVIGNIRNIADKTKKKKKLNRKSRQKVSNWPHGKLRNYIGYKAKRNSIAVDDKEDEAYTSQTCKCGNRYKPQGRMYSCKSCGFVTHRDVLGASNILSRKLFGELGRIVPTEIKYRRPFVKNEMRSQADTLQVALSS